MKNFTSLLLRLAILFASSDPSPPPAARTTKVSPTIYFRHKTVYSHRLQQDSCPAGSFPKSPSSSCQPCPPGTFAGLTDCLACPSGFFQDQSGQVMCIDCKTDLYGGPGSNAALVVDSKRQCLLIETEAPSLQPSTNPSLIQPSSIPRTSPSTSPPSIIAVTSDSPSNAKGAPSMVPSQSPTADGYDANATSFSSFSNSSVLTCTNNTFALHGKCSDCLSKHYALFNLLVFVMIFIMLIISIHTISPPHIFTYIQHLQSIGMLCLIQNVKLPLLVVNTLQQIYYWSGFDWTAIVTPNCVWGTSTSRLLVTCLPISLASLLQVVSNVFLKRCDTCTTYYLLVLLLFLPSVLVTVGEAVLCEGDYFCASAESWWPRLVPPLSIFFCATHFISLVLSIVEERHFTDSILHRIFGYWWWSYETILRRLIQISFIFFYDGRQCLLLFTGLDLCSTIWHFIFSLWAKPLPSRSVSALLCFCQVGLSVIAFIGEESSELSIVLGIFVLLLIFGSISTGLLFMDSGGVANDSNSTALDDEEEQAPTKRISDVDEDDQSLTPTFDAELPTAPTDKQQLEMAEPVDDPSPLEHEVVANAFHVSAPPISVLYDQAFSHSDQTLLANNHN